MKKNFLISVVLCLLTIAGGAKQVIELLPVACQMSFIKTPIKHKSTLLF